MWVTRMWEGEWTGGEALQHPSNIGLTMVRCAAQVCAHSGSVIHPCVDQVKSKCCIAALTVPRFYFQDLADMNDSVATQLEGTRHLSE
jgi:hypothetical protein